MVTLDGKPLSQRRLAALAGTAPALVRQIEVGKRSNSELKTITGLADVLGLTLDWLVHGIGQAPTQAETQRAVELAVRRAAAAPEVTEKAEARA